MKKKLEDLNLLDDFLFGSLVSYPGLGVKFIRLLLQIIFGRTFGKLVVHPQKVYYGSDTDKHGTRLDVYLEEEQESDFTAEEDEEPGGATIYDVEPDQNDNEAARTALPKRIRFYHAKIDAQSLKSGETYHALKNVVIIIITPYDPFGIDRMVYTIQNRCREEPDMLYDDGAMTVYLYTKGHRGNPPEELQKLLRYMEHTTEENATTKELQDIQQMVEVVKRDGEVSIEYMKIYEREEMLLNRGRQEGRREGELRERTNTEAQRLRADAAEQENARLRAELARLKAGQV
ncbi:MAG: hypothetical protein Q4F28_01125 [Eubacteriales bacterium]|nr:hypothetical protein [Eubacteriales bacterium]